MTDQHPSPAGDQYPASWHERSYGDDIKALRRSLKFWDYIEGRQSEVWKALTEKILWCRMKLAEQRIDAGVACLACDGMGTREVAASHRSTPYTLTCEVCKGGGRTDHEWHELPETWWMDNSVDRNFIDRFGNTVREQSKAPSGDACF